MEIIDMIVLALIAFALLWIGYAVFQKFWPSAAATTTGVAIGKVVDRSQDWTAMATLRLIRWMDEVEGNPAALAAWEVLYAAIGGTPYSPDELPKTTNVIPAASAPHITAADPVETVVFDSSGHVVT